MRRLLPHPAVSGFLFVVWLVLVQSVSPAALLTAGLLAVALGLLFQRLQPDRIGLRKPYLLIPLAAHVAFDIVRSNLAVAEIIIRGRHRGVTSGFMEVPLDIRSRYGLVVLGCIITSTPGTIWVSHELDENVLLIHVLDLVDEDAWVRKIKDRYERPLMEIFQ